MGMGGWGDGGTWKGSNRDMGMGASGGLEGVGARGGLWVPTMVQLGATGG